VYVGGGGAGPTKERGKVPALGNLSELNT